jgi:hypothetical protein
MAVSAASALNVAGSDTDARDYTTASWTPTAGKIYLVCFAVHDLGGSPQVPSIAGNNITWGRVGNDVGGGTTQPAMAVWAGYADSSATAGTITFSACVPSGQTADGAIWGIAELTDAARGADTGMVQSAVASTTNDTVTATLAAFASVDNATGGWFLSYDNAGGALTNTAGSGFTITTGLNAQQTSGGDTMRLSFEFRNDNDTSVDGSASAANDRMLMHAVEIRAAITYTRTMTITGDGTFAATAFRTQNRTATISGTGTFAASAYATRSRTATINGTGTFTASATRTAFRDATITGTGTFTPETARTAFRTIDIAGTGTFVPSTLRTTFGSCTITGTGTFLITAVGPTPPITSTVTVAVFAPLTVGTHRLWQKSRSITLS